MAGVQESALLEDGTSRDTMNRHYSLNGLLTQYIQWLLQAKGFCIASDTFVNLDRIWESAVAEKKLACLKL